MARRTARRKAGCGQMLLGCMGMIVICGFIAIAINEMLLIPTASPVTTKSLPTSTAIDHVDEVQRLPGIKRMVEVRLKRRITKEELRDIALTLKARDPGTYENTFITYLLPGMVAGNGYWATTHFRPELDVHILGMTKGTAGLLRKLPANSPPGLLGYWLDTSMRYCIYKKNGQFHMDTAFDDGGVRKEKLVEMPFKGGRKFVAVGFTRPGDGYYVIGSGPNLQIWLEDLNGDHSVIRTCEKLD